MSTAHVTKWRFSTVGDQVYQSRTSHFASWDTRSWTLYESGEMSSSNHAPLNTDIDDGGAWLLNRTWDVCSPTWVQRPNFIGPWTVGGEADPYSGGLLIPAHQSDASLTTAGTTMMARSMPTNSSADFAVGTAELLREGVPSLIGLQTMKQRSRTLRDVSRKGGSEYLNIEFGWKPLVAEIRSLAKAVKESEQTWAAYRKGSAKKTRVGHQLRDDQDRFEYRGRFSSLPARLNTFCYGTRIDQTRNRVWFKGAFKYYVPEPVGFSGKMQYWSSQADKLYGAKLDPEVLWNLAPWSWAIDWFTNTGDVIHNISQLGNDGLVLQYGYAMNEVLRRESKTASAPEIGGSTRVVQSKRCRRIPASPYGFGVTLSSLSARQTAILVALGLSR